MTILWNCFEIGVNCFQGFIMIYFAYKFLGGKFGKGYFKNHGVIFSVMLAATITILNLITAFEHVLALLYLLPILLFSCFCLEGTLPRKIFASVLPVVINLAASALIANISSLLFRESLYEMITQPGIPRMIALLTTQSLVLYLTLISLRLFRKSKDHRELYVQEWILISLLLLLGILMGAVLNMIALEARSDKISLYVSVGILLIMLLNILFITMISMIGKKNTAIRIAETNLMKKEYLEQYVQNADTEYELIKKTRHDMKDIYLVANDLLEHNMYDEASKYLKRIYKLLDSTVSYVNTKNAVANSIINAKLTVANSLGIHAICMSADDFQGIDDIDLCRLLANMLENAITATEQVTDDDKIIELKITENLGAFTFLLKNTISHPVIETDHKLHTTKSDRDNHGYGIRIIKEIAEKYQGRFDFYEQDNQFCCMVILNTR